ncbi:APC family permease [Allofustis seminis]|uniref:APC family permease n=1 Tax=Allofustis seminis TaxID=166939 RepID=UPI0003708554|nr:APC family permease [Allofustis seminis]
MENNTELEPKHGLQKSLKLIFVYTVATGSIFTFVSYWDSVFYGYCGPGTFLAFALMTLAILPTALVYSELSSLFHTSGGELIYNTVGLNKHFGFLSSWMIMAAWISVPPAVVMGIATYLNTMFQLNLSPMQIMAIGVVMLILVFAMSLQEVTFLVKAQATFLFLNITTTIITGLLLLFSGHWHIANFGNVFQTTLDSIGGIPGWVIGMALLITPYFGFETVPQMVEEGDFPITDTKKAICGSVLTCGAIYTFFFFCLGGINDFSGFKALLDTTAENGFLSIFTLQTEFGWTLWPLIWGLISILLGMTASVLGFWMSTVRMLYSMGEKNFLPKVFTKVNKHQQPILPNVFLLGISLTFIILMNSGDFFKDFFNLMSFGCACAYALTMISAVRIRTHHAKWYQGNQNVVKGGNVLRILAMFIMIAIAFFCTLGQGRGSWISFGIYLGIGVMIWLWMVVVRWKDTKVSIETPDGMQEF